MSATHLTKTFAKNSQPPVLPSTASMQLDAFYKNNSVLGSNSSTAVSKTAWFSLIRITSGETVHFAKLRDFSTRMQKTQMTSGSLILDHTHIYIPRALYSYIPLIPQLKLLYANPEYSLKMRYPSTLTEKPWDDGIRDMWEGNAMRFWKRKGFFTDERTVALHFSTDGVQLFRNSTQEVWPFLILNLNLPPEEWFNPSYVQSNMKIQHRQLLAPGIVSQAIPTQKSRFLSYSLSSRTRNSPPWSSCI